jgi:endonuclease/exonuclease/phosphatase family metal-dependent hydrolase
MVGRPFEIATINVRRGNERTHAILQTNQADIILMQEPWFNRIGVSRSDTSHEGVEVRGFVNHNMWDTFAPTVASDSTPKVVAYAQASIRGECTITNELQHPAADHCCQVLLLTVGEEQVRIVNFYHHVEVNRPRLHRLTASSFDNTIPTILMGDFNTHSHSWSCSDILATSTWADGLEDWLEHQTFSLLSPAGVPTRHGEGTSQRDTVLDLILVNSPGMWGDLIHFRDISFELSLGSDHALLTATWCPELFIPSPDPHATPKWHVLDSMKDAWCTHFRTLSESRAAPADPLRPLLPPDTDADAQALLQDIIDCNDHCFDRARPGPPKGARWWNESCTGAYMSAKSAADGSARREAYRLLRTVVRQAKRDWAEQILIDATNDENTMWSVTKWRKGRHSNIIPPLRTLDHRVSGNHTDMTEALHSCFFPSSPLAVQPQQLDDPDPRPRRVHHPIATSEVAACLADTSNTSAPGLSGVGYQVIKWAFEASPGRFTHLFDNCLTTGSHPWKNAKVVVIPKPGKPDYSAPKAYRPIALLECCGKLLEKIVAKRIMSDSNAFGLISPHQFGSRDYHCTTDAVLTITHNAESCIKAGKVGTLILFDIQGFFDHINAERAVHTLELMGFSDAICRWTQAFLAPRQMHLNFNGVTSDAFSVDTGTPQGSPLSPILSAVYTSFMLDLLNRTWKGMSIQLYVDDGAIFASGPTMRSSITTAVRGLEEALQWLHRNGLRTDSDKTEIMLFHP